MSSLVQYIGHREQGEGTVALVPPEVHVHVHAGTHADSAKQQLLLSITCRVSWVQVPPRLKQFIFSPEKKSCLQV